MICCSNTNNLHISVYLGCCDETGTEALFHLELTSLQIRPVIQWVVFLGVTVGLNSSACRFTVSSEVEDKKQFLALTLVTSEQSNINAHSRNSASLRVPIAEAESDFETRDNEDDEDDDEEKENREGEKHSKVNYLVFISEIEGQQMKRPDDVVLSLSVIHQ